MMPDRRAASGDGEERVTHLELFFDLVFVFAITQVTALMPHEPTGRASARAMLVLTALWFAWASFAWLTNTINPEEGGVRLAIFATMAALLICSLAVPQALRRRRGDLRHRLLLRARRCTSRSTRSARAADATLGGVVRDG